MIATLIVVAVYVCIFAAPIFFLNIMPGIKMSLHRCENKEIVYDGEWASNMNYHCKGCGELWECWVGSRD